MSVCAISTGNQTCLVNLIWLRQYYFLKTSGNDTCFTEIIVEVKEGNLEYLELFVPYRISDLEDRTSSFLDIRSQLFFNNCYKIEGIDPKNSKQGNIYLKLIKPIGTELNLNIQEITLKKSDTVRGSKVRINFSRPLLSENISGIRIVFDCDCISKKLFENTYNIGFRYYTVNDAVTLNIENALDIQNLDIWTVFPSISDIDSNSLSHPAKPRTYYKDHFHPDYYDVILGSRNKKIWSKFPIISLEWINPGKEPDKPVLEKWTILQISAQFTVHKPEIEKEIFAEIKEEKELARMWTHETGTEDITPKGEPIEKEIIRDKELKRITKEINNLDNISTKYSFHGIVGKSNEIQEVINHIIQIKNTNIDVLITGENGVGKEPVARAIHETSFRKDKAFIPLVISTIPKNLLDAELFGIEHGVATDVKARIGKFEKADKGTLFIDEIGEIPKQDQVKLLRVLQERKFERVGGDKSIHVNVRIIAATSRNLETEIEDEKFREDLYYRLNVFPIHLPPLKDRRSDIVLLADYFIRKYNKVYEKNIKRISTTAINMMMAYHWPGNVRELENCTERAILVTPDEVIHGYNMPPSLQTADHTNTALLPADGASLKDMVDAYEKEVLVDALKQHRGNATAASRHLQTTQRIINYKIKALGINAARYR